MASEDNIIESHNNKQVNHDEGQNQENIITHNQQGHNTITATTTTHSQGSSSSSSSHIIVNGGLSSLSVSSPSDAKPSTSSSAKKEESPFSFRHFLKRDLSLPTTSTASNLEGTGARPKVYSTSAHPSHPSLTRLDQNRDTGYDASESFSPNTIDINDYNKVRHRSNEQLGMPSLPDFVQDHLLVEQAYLGTDATLPLDFENLPDFTINLNADRQRDGSSSRPRSELNDSFDTDAESGRPVKNVSRSCKSVPVDLGASGDGPRNYDDPDRMNPLNDERPFPLDLPNHISLDLTDSLNHSHRRDNNRMSFPLDLPDTGNATGGESLRLPDFLPAQAGNGNAAGSLHREDFSEERRLRLAAERELRAALQTSASLRRELSEARASEFLARKDATEARSNAAKIARQLHGGGRISSTLSANSSTEDDTYSKRSSSEDSLVARLRLQIDQLKNELASTQTELEQLRNNRRNVSRTLTQATNSAEASLRELLSGIDQLRGLASTMDPP